MMKWLCYFGMEVAEYIMTDTFTEYVNYLTSLCEVSCHLGRRDRGETVTENIAPVFPSVIHVT